MGLGDSRGLMKRVHNDSITFLENGISGEDGCATVHMLHIEYDLWRFMSYMLLIGHA